MSWKNLPTTYKINPKFPDPTIIDAAVEVLREGGLIIYPTDTVYGIGSNAMNAEAVLRIFKAKRRPQNQSLPVAISSIEMAENIAYVTKDAKKLMEKFWPGALTIVLKSKGVLPVEVTARENSVGIRIPNHEVPLAIIRRAGFPLISTSANMHGMPSPITADEAAKQLGLDVNIVLDAGVTKLHVSSTVIDLTASPPVVFRGGPISIDSIKAVIGEVLVAAGK
jgi:L-threonylcarbamoyladenylate synthase